MYPMKIVWRTIDNKDITLTDNILGSGAFSMVIEGKYMGKFPVAIKVYDLTSFDDTGQMEEMFNREFSILCSVCHPNIVTFYGGIKLNIHGSPSYRIVTEKLKQNLKQYIEKSNESLEDKDKFPILRVICISLEWFTEI